MMETILLSVTDAVRFKIDFSNASSVSEVLPFDADPNIGEFQDQGDNSNFTN
jgi:hypothetical protein